ncbi:MAG: helix-turn-helix domain-containing protein [Bacteroidota bacterium]
MTDKQVFQKVIGLNLRRLRSEKDLTIEQLALEAGLAYSQISRIELGKLNATAYTVHILAKTLGVSPSEFFREDILGEQIPGDLAPA